MMESSEYRPGNGDELGCVIDLPHGCREQHFDEGEHGPPQTADPGDKSHFSTIRHTPSGSGSEVCTMNKNLVVSVVDDDESVRESLPELLKTFGFVAKAFSSAEEFLGSANLIDTACLILDVAMPVMSGPELQHELNKRRISMPIIFITAQRDETVRSKLIRQGAVACLFKPFSEAALLDALNSALP